MAQPLRRRLPISAEAVSDCCRRRRISSVSAGRAKVGELRVLETSVGGVEVPDTPTLDDVATSELAMEIRFFDPDGMDWDGSSSQFTQNSTTGVLPPGDRIIGILHLGHALSVKICVQAW